MSTDYYNSLYLNKTPTGFGGYTGVKVVNSGNFPITYTASISNTTFVTSPVAGDAVDGLLYDTLYVSKDSKYFDINTNSVDLFLNPAETGFFYLMHRPFSTFTAGNESTGIETAVLSIYSNSILGDSDEAITIDVTGQRVITFETPNNVGRFYGLKDYDADNGYNIKFNWLCIDGYSYITGFRLDLSNYSNFSSYQAYYLPVVRNNQIFLPNYGDYSGFFGESFSFQIGNLSLSSDYYSRIAAINEGGIGGFTYATGFWETAPNYFDDATYSGLHPNPGENLNYTKQILELEYKTDYTTDFDLADFIVSANGSYDFSAYSGITVKFSPLTRDFGVLAATTNEFGAINLTPKQALRFNVGDGNVFAMQLEFENMKVLSAGGFGVQFNSDGSVSNAGDGGPIFNFDNLNYTDSTDTLRKFNYYIQKDVDSIFYAGLGGGAGLAITDTSDISDLELVPGREINLLDSLNLRTSDILSTAFVIEGDETPQGLAGFDGATVGRPAGGNFYPDVYLGFKPRNSNFSNNIYFRFTSEDITDSAGTATDSWASRDGIINSFSLSSTSNILVVREAYGKKFYELLSSGTENENKISSASVELPVSSRPSYTILVFALAKNDLNNNDKLNTYKAMLGNAGKIHSFVHVDGGSYFEDASSVYPVNFKEVNSNFYSTFCGSTLNYPTILDQIQYETSAGRTATYTLVNYADLWRELNPNSTLYDQNTTSFNEGEYYSWGVGARRGIYTSNIDSPVTISRRYSFKNFNICDLGNITSPDVAVDFVLDEGGSSVDLKAFSLFFVQVHGTVNSRNVQELFLNQSNLREQSIELTNRYFLKNETFINGLKTSETEMAVNLDSLPVNGRADYYLHLNNSTTESTNKTRLFLFDYIYGEESTASKRDSVSKNIVEYLAYSLSPILLKSATDFKIAGVENSVNTSLGFPSPLSHPYLNLYSNSIT